MPPRDRHPNPPTIGNLRALGMLGGKRQIEVVPDCPPYACLGAGVQANFKFVGPLQMCFANEGRFQCLQSVWSFQPFIF